MTTNIDKKIKTQQPIRCKKLLLTTLTSALLGIGAPAMAELTEMTVIKVDASNHIVPAADKKPATISNDSTGMANNNHIDRIGQLISETEGVTANSQPSVADRLIEQKKREIKKPEPKNSTEQANKTPVVKPSEASQDDDKEDGGRAVAGIGFEIDEASIKSIESKNGKIYTTTSLSSYAQAVNSAAWASSVSKNTALTVKMQTLLDWNHASPGPIDGGWGDNSIKALSNFQKMRGLPSTGSMDSATWRELTKNIDPNQPVLVKYTITKEDMNTTFAPTPSGAEAQSKVKGLYYESIQEMLAERFHMDIRYINKLNKGKRFVEGDVITVINVADPLKAKINRLVADKADKTLYAYAGDKLVAAYPTTIGSTNTPSPTGTFKIANKVKMPWYRATVNKGTDKQQVFMLPPGPNNPVGVVWMGLSKPSYGIHGSPVPEGISRQSSAGCIRLTNWDVLELFANIEKGATVEIK